MSKTTNAEIEVKPIVPHIMRAVEKGTSREIAIIYADIPGADVFLAAPEMLAALRVVLPMLENAGYGGNNAHAEKKHIAMIREAIEKAEGRA